MIRRAFAKQCKQTKLKNEFFHTHCKLLQLLIIWQYRFQACINKIFACIDESSNLNLIFFLDILFFFLNLKLFLQQRISHTASCLFFFFLLLLIVLVLLSPARGIDTLSVLSAILGDWFRVLHLPEMCSLSTFLYSASLHLFHSFRSSYNLHL